MHNRTDEALTLLHARGVAVTSIFPGTDETATAEEIANHVQSFLQHARLGDCATIDFD